MKLKFSFCEKMNSSIHELIKTFFDWLNIIDIISLC